MHFRIATGISTFGLNLSRVGSQISIIGSTASVNTVGLEQQYNSMSWITLFTFGLHFYNQKQFFIIWSGNVMILETLEQVEKS